MVVGMSQAQKQQLRHEIIIIMTKTRHSVVLYAFLKRGP